MESTARSPISVSPTVSPRRALRWFLLPPVAGFVLLLLIVATIMTTYQSRHQARIFSGVEVWGTDVGGMTVAEARSALAATFPYDSEEWIRLTDPATGDVWRFSPADMGITYDLDKTLAAAYDVGRQGGPLQVTRDQFAAWYYGRSLAPIIVFDEAQLDAVLGQITEQINRPAIDARLQFDGRALSYSPGQVGRTLDVANTRERLLAPVTSFREVDVELLVHQAQPNVLDDGETEAHIQTILSAPMTLYFREPLQDIDLAQMEASTAQLAEWLRVEQVQENGAPAHYNVFIDENAVRNWLSEVEALIFRKPENARYYFDDDTRQLVLVEPHVNGRALDVEATLDQFMRQVGTPNRSLPFVVRDIRPTVHSGATAEELQIRELVAESTTWFYGSTPERKHNIARAAAQFFGIVVAPGEEFSFNRYLGDVTEDAGFTTGLVIIGGRTVKGVGGGVCQVSTTLYQTAFYAGFPITDRLEHGYQVHYYDDGEGPGMDATVFEPIVDLKFVNNTDYHLLIENYYNETFESLTFKFYSTDTGRVVEKDGPYFDNVQPPTEPVWEYNEELEEGEIIKVDWAVEGAEVTVFRRVFDEFGNLLYGEEQFVSNYIPWHDGYQYGPGVDPDNVPRSEIPD